MPHYDFTAPVAPDDDSTAAPEETLEEHIEFLASIPGVTPKASRAIRAKLAERPGIAWESLVVLLPVAAANALEASRFTAEDALPALIVATAKPKAPGKPSGQSLAVLLAPLTAGGKSPLEALDALRAMVADASLTSAAVRRLEALEAAHKRHADGSVRLRAERVFKARAGEAPENLAEPETEPAEDAGVVA